MLGEIFSHKISFKVLIKYKVQKKKKKKKEVGSRSGCGRRVEGAGKGRREPFYSLYTLLHLDVT